MVPEDAELPQALVVAAVVEQRHAGSLGCRADQEVYRGYPPMISGGGKQHP
jgi:hypothetical protein